MADDAPLAAAIAARAREWFGAHHDCRPWERGGEDFLSATLCEAVLMQAVLGKDFPRWLASFMPDPYGPFTACLRTSLIVSDRTDGQFAHLDGLNLSRAWCWRSIADALPDPGVARTVADEHLSAALPHLGDHDMGKHWLMTFALLALAA